MFAFKLPNFENNNVCLFQFASLVYVMSKLCMYNNNNSFLEKAQFTFNFNFY